MKIDFKYGVSHDSPFQNSHSIVYPGSRLNAKLSNLAAKRQNVDFRYGVSSDSPFINNATVIHPSTNTNILSPKCKSLQSIIWYLVRAKIPNFFKRKTLLHK